MVAAIVVALLVFQPFSHRSSDEATGPQSSVVRPTPTTASSVPITPSGPIASIPGTFAAGTVRTFSDVIALNFLASDEITIYRSGGTITNVDFALVHNGPDRVVILLVGKQTAAGANQVTQGLSSLMITYRMVVRTGGPVGVSIQAADNATGGPLRRAEYSSGDYVVYIEVQGPSARGVDDLMASTLGAQLVNLPAR
jgi:hypothetical protein